MGNQLYIPEIGSLLKLTEDWSFTLHAEFRNETLGTIFGYYLKWGSVWIHAQTLPDMRERDYNLVKYPDRADSKYRGWFGHGRFDEDAYLADCRAVEQACPEYVKWHEDNNIWRSQVEQVGVAELPITFPAGTVLKVDRIYIRKGSSDFSSISFWAHGLPTPLGKKPKAARFWAKLQECNKIQFELVNSI